MVTQVRRPWPPVEGSEPVESISRDEWLEMAAPVNTAKSLHSGWRPWGWGACHACSYPSSFPHQLGLSLVSLVPGTHWSPVEAGWVRSGIREAWILNI